MATTYYPVTLELKGGLPGGMSTLPSYALLHIDGPSTDVLVKEQNIGDVAKWLARDLKGKDSQSFALESTDVRDFVENGVMHYAVKSLDARKRAELIDEVRRILGGQ